MKKTTSLAAVGFGSTPPPPSPPPIPQLTTLCVEGRVIAYSSQEAGCGEE